MPRHGHKPDIDEVEDYPLNQNEGEWTDMVFSYLYRIKVLLKSYFWILLLGIGIGMAYEAYKQSKLPVVYRSSGQMIVAGTFSVGAAESAYRNEYSNFFGTQIRLMESKRVRKAAQDRVAALNPDLQPSHVTFSASQSPRANIFILETQGSEPEYTQAFLDAVMHEFLNFKKEMRSQSAENTFVSVTDKILELEKEISVVEAQKVAFQKNNNLVFIQEQGNSSGAYLAELNDQLASMTIKYDRLKSINFEEFVNKPFTSEIEQILTDENYNLPVDDYLGTRQLLDQLLAEKEEFAEYMRPNHPRIIGLNQSIEKQEYLLKVFRRQSVRQLIKERESLETEITNLKETVREWEVKALDYSQRLAEFERIESQLDRLKSSYEQLLSLTQSIDLNTNLAQQPISILEPASTPYKVQHPLMKKVVLGAFGGFLFGAGIIYVIAVFDNRIFASEDITHRFDEPVLGVIPRQTVHGGKNVPLLRQNDDRMAFAEAFRNIRSSLLYLHEEDFKPRTFLVTSSVPGEGKSTIVSNLAAAFSFTASKTLLIDADMRKGYLHKSFGLRNPIGLSDLIAERLDFRMAVQKTEFPNLDVISRGQLIDGTGDLLVSHELNAFIEKALGEYDFVLFDSPPVLAADDTSSFASKLDAVLFITRSTITKVRQARISVSQLHMRNAHIVGFVLNGMDSNLPGYGYYYSEYYTHSHRKASSHKSNT